MAAKLPRLLLAGAFVLTGPGLAWGLELPPDEGNTAARQPPATPAEAMTRAAELGRTYRAQCPRPVYQTAEEAAAFEQAVEAYRCVLEKFPGSDHAPLAQRSLANLYAYRGHRDIEVELLEDLAERWKGTMHETDAYLTLGLDYLQALLDPAGAIAWLEKIPNPGGLTGRLEEIERDDRGLLGDPQKRLDA